MKLPEELFSDGIGERKVYYFSTPLINTGVPHYFICIRKRPDETLILTCCTSQFDTVRRFVETRQLPYETLVHISPKDDQNPFSKETYVNCNNCYISSISDFIIKYRTDAIEFSGEVSEIHYEQVLIGIHASPMIAEEIKNFLPNPLED